MSSGRRFESPTIPPRSRSLRSAFRGSPIDREEPGALRTRLTLACVRRGGLGNPLSDEELARKFHGNAVRSLPEEGTASS